MTVEEKAYNYASKVVKNRLTASEVAAHYGRGYIEGQEDMKQLGWHPANELPPVNENLISELVLCWCVDSTFHTLEPKLGRVWRGEWCFKDVKYWCYPPKEE